MKKYWKFAAIIGVILATLAWLAVAGINENKTYYITVAELLDTRDAVRELGLIR